MILAKDFATAEEAAEHLSRRRARLLPVLVLMYLALQLDLGGKIHATGMFDVERGLAWLILTAALYSLVASSGPEALMRPAWRPFLDDELTRMHRLKAQAFGFRATGLAAFSLLVAELWVDFSALQVIHLLVTFGVAAAALRYAMLERRAFKA